MGIAVPQLGESEHVAEQVVVVRPGRRQGGIDGFRAGFERRRCWIALRTRSAQRYESAIIAL